MIIGALARVKRVLCRFGWHDYELSRDQRDLGYRRERCSRCGEASYEPR